MRAGPSQEEIRRHNLGVLLKYVHIHGATSRAELTTALGLNRSTIGALTTDLTAAGLVAEGETRETGRAGRPSLVVRPESARVFAYAASIEVDALRVARIGLGGKVLGRRDAERPRGLAPADTVPLLGELIKEMGQEVPGGSLCVGAGLSVSGMTRQADGVVRPIFAAVVDGEGEKPLAERLAEEIGINKPVAVGKAADLCALAEHARGTAVGCDDVIYLHRDVGVDAGIIVGGRRLTGYGGHGGEVGHMVVHPGGRECGCGGRGCWETAIGEYALLHAAGRDVRVVGQAAVLRVVDAAARGDASAQLAVRQVGDWLGLGVANLINVFNPEMVVFGGTLREVYLAAAAQVRSRLNGVALAAAREQVRLRTPALGDDAALIGAAELAFEHLLADPLTVA